jgi:hypothetical protein
MKGEEQMNIEAKLTQLKQKLDNLADINYRVTEHFTHINTYNLTGLSVEIDEEYVIFNDSERILLDNDNFVLSMFLLVSLHDIDIWKDYIVLRFDCGYIKIEF